MNVSVKGGAKEQAGMTAVWEIGLPGICYEAYRELTRSWVSMKSR